MPETPPPGDGRHADAPVAGNPVLDGFLAAWLRGERPGWGADWKAGSAAGAEAALAARIELHGIALLLADRVGEVAGLPETLAADLRATRIARLGWEEMHRRAIAEAIDALAGHGIRPVVFKGTACAYDLYPDPVTRLRSDTDILVADADRDAAFAALVEAGFARDSSTVGETAARQASFTRRDAGGWNHAIDLHWQFSNATLLAGLFPHGELAERGHPLSALHAEARAPNLTDTILIACTHRQMHRTAPIYIDGVAHACAERLIWLQDIHLAVARMAEADWPGLIARARAKGLAQITAEGLADAAATLGTVLPEGLLADLRTGLDPARPEAPAAFMTASRHRRMWLNFRAQKGLANRLAFARQILFPDPAYLRQSYEPIGPRWLPWLYVERLMRGAVRWLGARRARK